VEGQAIRGGGETGVANGDNQLAEGKMRVAKWGRRGRVGEVVRDQDRRSLRCIPSDGRDSNLDDRTAEEERTAKRASKADQGQRRAVRGRTNPRARGNKERKKLRVLRQEKLNFMERC